MSNSYFSYKTEGLREKDGGRRMEGAGCRVNNGGRMIEVMDEGLRMEGGR